MGEVMEQLLNVLNLLYLDFKVFFYLIIVIFQVIEEFILFFNLIIKYYY